MFIWGKKGGCLPHSHNIDKARTLLDLGKLLCQKGDLNDALPRLNEARDIFIECKAFDKYLDTINLILRIFAEQNKFNEVTEVKDQIQDLALRESFELTPKTYYTLGICALYKKQLTSSQSYFEKSLSLSLDKDSKKDVCYAISGLVYSYLGQNKYSEALKELSNLEVFFRVIPDKELELNSLLTHGIIHLRMGELEKALEVFWSCYDLLKVQKNYYQYVTLLYFMGKTYVDLGDLESARIYLKLAKKSIDSENMIRLAASVELELKKIGGEEEDAYDLVFKESMSFLVEKRKGQVNFKNQFVLMDMLRLFMETPGEVYSKEDLVNKVWRQQYDPRVHDNKIYVTIKRLRKMIEPDYAKPTYIFRSKNGYYLNKNTRVLIEKT
jgi:tetratricopeptide (TPR) repeat protein